MKFVEAILSNNSTDDHCREFVTQKGLLPLMGILGLPNLPIDFPASPACQAVASVCKSILVGLHDFAQFIILFCFAFSCVCCVGLCGQCPIIGIIGAWLTVGFSFLSCLAPFVPGFDVDELTFGITVCCS